MTLEEMYFEIYRGNAILFAGAGFSYNSRNTLDARPAIGDDLVTILANEVDDHESTTLEEAAEYYIKKKGVDSAIATLRAQYLIKNYDGFYDRLLSHDWRRIYTTNYDNLIDQSLKKLKPKTEIKSNEQDPKEVANLRSLCLHINGSIETVNRLNIHEYFKLTSKSYLTKSFVESSWSGLFQSDLENCGAIVVIGYSFRNDLDLKRFFYNLAESRNKTIIVTKPGETDRNREMMSEFGTVLDLGVEIFATNLAKAEPEVGIKEEARLTSFSKVSTELLSPQSSYDDMKLFDLFMFGKFDTSVMNDSGCYENYLVQRTKTTSVLNWVSRGERLIVVHGSLGNGKSVMARSVAHELAKSVDCYFLNESNSRTTLEYESLVAENRRVVIIVDNYVRYKEFIQWADRFDNAQVTFILFERAITGEYLFKSERDYKIIDINRLDQDELQSLQRLMDNFPAVWGNKAKLKEDQKAEFLAKECRSNFQTILVNLLRSQDIVNRYSDLFNDVKSREVFPLFQLVLLNSFLNLRLKVDHISYLLDSDILFDGSIVGDERMKELFEVRDDVPTMRSAILAHELARRVQNVVPVFSILARIAERAQRVARFNDSDVYFNLLKQINSYTNLRSLYGGSKGFYEALSEYFQKLQYIDFYKENSHFWLQYAISTLDLGNIAFSERCFEVARKYSGKGSFSQLFIDNHYSRLLLEKAFKTKMNSDAAFGLFKEAHELLFNPLFVQEEWNYIFKVALNYESVLSKYLGAFGDAERIYVRSAIAQVKDLLNRFKARIDSFYFEERTSISKCEEMIARIEKMRI